MISIFEIILLYCEAYAANGLNKITVFIREKLTDIFDLLTSKNNLLVQAMFSNYSVGLAFEIM
jgi:hypothetical protein